SIGTFTNFVNEQDYKTIYHFKNGVTFTPFYETKIDSICNLKIEMQYRWQNADMNIDYDFGHSSFYKNIDYSFHLLNLNLICSFRLVEKKSFKLRFLFGAILGYNINTLAKGSGWEYHSQTQIDTNGNPIQILTTRQWEKDERHSKDLSIFNVGVDLGLDMIIPINNRMDFLIQNRYNIFITSITRQKNLRYTSLFSGYLNIGFRYNFYNHTAANKHRSLQ
ncbi:MAG: hypothetical protein RR356_01225, partial [Bacteroidales bacterium]